jgi:hypothetical protein
MKEQIQSDNANNQSELQRDPFTTYRYDSFCIQDGKDAKILREQSPVSKSSGKVGFMNTLKYLMKSVWYLNGLIQARPL